MLQLLLHLRICEVRTHLHSLSKSRDVLFLHTLLNLCSRLLLELRLLLVELLCLQRWLCVWVEDQSSHVC